MVHSYQDVLARNSNEPTTGICNSMGEPQNNYIDPKKPEKEYVCFYICKVLENIS